MAQWARLSSRSSIRRGQSGPPQMAVIPSSHLHMHWGRLQAVLHPIAQQCAAVRPTRERAEAAAPKSCISLKALAQCRAPSCRHGARADGLTPSNPLLTAGRQQLNVGVSSPALMMGQVKENAVVFHLATSRQDATRANINLCLDIA